MHSPQPKKDSGAEFLKLSCDIGSTKVRKGSTRFKFETKNIFSPVRFT